MPSLRNGLVIELARRASTREASRVHHQLNRGIATLAIIAKTAAYLAILCTNLTLIAFFSRGITGDRRMWAHLVAPIFGEALIPIALGLAVALFVEWAHNTLTTRLDRLDIEMKAAIVELTTSRLDRRASSDGSAVSKNNVSASTMFARASSIDEPWLAMSNSGQSATKPSSSRLMIAVTRSACFMVRVYNRSVNPTQLRGACPAGLESNRSPNDSQIFSSH
jgi:hypothetical protein